MRIALVGLGEAGFLIHLPSLQGLASVQVVGACDPDAARRERAAAKYRVPTFADCDTMLGETRPDLVVIGTPPDTHAAYCVKALNAGAHVICEKPFASSLAEVDIVLDAAARTGRRVALNHEFREMPIFRALRDELLRPGSGELVFVQVWQLMDMPPWAEPGWRGRMLHRTLYEAGVHLIDLLMALFGEKPVSVQASSSTGGLRDDATDAVVLVTLEFSRGRLAQLMQNRLCKGETQYFEVRADTTEASLRASFGGRARLSAGLFRTRKPHARFEYGPSGLAWKDVHGRRTLLARNPRDPNVAATRRVFERTIEAFENGGQPPATGQHGRDVLEVTAACYHSAATGRRVRLDAAEAGNLVSLRMGAPPLS